MRKKPNPPAPISDALRNFDQLPNSANVRRPVVRALFGCSDTTIWRRVKDGTLPSPSKMSPRIATWNVGEIRAALDCKS